MKNKIFKLTFYIIFIKLLVSSNPVYGLDINQILEDIKELPIEKIQFNQEEKEKLKAIQLFVLPKTIKELEDSMDAWKEMGINTLILRVFHNEKDRYHYFKESPINKGVYFKTNHAPVISDTLGDFIPLAKSRGFKVYAWMTTRYADYNHNDLDKVISYSPFKNTFSTSKGLNILSESVQKYLFSLFSDLASYPIDGILLQDDLFLRYNEGFDNNTLNKFKNETGININPKKLYIVNDNENHVKYTDEFWILRDWKSRKIAEFVGNLRNHIKKINPNVNIAVNLTYEAISHPKGALAWLAHDLEHLKNVSDYFSLMAYHRQIMDELKIDKKSSYIYLADMIEKCLQKFPEEPQRVLFKLQIKDWKTGEKIPDDEIIELIKHTKDINKLSIAIVPYPPEPTFEILKLVTGS
ncbi:MAG: family 10 glycosylhydrolase [Proteobacteria bacterium]|nr:family 10 glycosylhydrolase [Pseudomonadota bacterium]